MAEKKRGSSKAPKSTVAAPVAPVIEGQKATTDVSSEPQDKLLAFMVAVATDPIKLGIFIRDPVVAMAEAGISEVDQAVMKSGNPLIIHARLSGQKFSFTPPGDPSIQSIPTPDDSTSTNN